MLSGIALNTERGCRCVVPKRQRVKDRIEKKKRMGQTAKERQSRQVVRLQVKKKQSTERKERKREWEKRRWLLVGSEEKRGLADLA